jgi:preprotein translocase subunit SecG
MQSFSTPLTILHVGTCILLILTVLLQSGKGADISATLGGSSQTIFGSSGGANFFQKLTATLAAIFFCTSLVLTLLNSQEKKSVFEGMKLPEAPLSAPGALPQQPAGTAAPAQSAPAQSTTTPQSSGAAAPTQK